MSASSTRAVTVKAMMCSSRWVLARRRIVGQRAHCALAPGLSAGTICNSPQPGHSRSCGRVAGGGSAAGKRRLTRGPRRGTSSIGAMPSASRPTAALIAATSPGTPGAGGGTTKRKLCKAGRSLPRRTAA